MKEKIKALLDQIKRNFPNGCKDVYCDDCPLNDADHATVEMRLCDLLSSGTSEPYFIHITEPDLKKLEKQE